MALVLSRKLEEAVIIDGRIVVRIARVDRGRVRLAITAPQEVSVHREEVYARLTAQETSRFGENGRREH